MTTSSLVLRPATSADTADLERLAALDSARPLAGEVMLAHADGERPRRPVARDRPLGRRPVLPQPRARCRCCAPPPASALAAAARGAAPPRAAAPRARVARYLTFRRAALRRGGYGNRR